MRGGLRGVAFADVQRRGSVRAALVAAFVLAAVLLFAATPTGSADSGIVPIGVPIPPDAPVTAATTYQINALHDGHASGPLLPPLAEAWSVDLPGMASYPLVVNRRVFIAARNVGPYGATLHAFDERTGARLWGPVSLPGTYYINGLAADGQNVYSINFDGKLRAFDQATGAQVWQIQLPGQYAFTSPPTVVDGVIYVGGAGSGGTLYAVNTLGFLMWTAGVANGDHSSPAVTDDAIYVSYACELSYRFGHDGAPVWVHTTNCSGGGGRTPVVHGDRVYVRDDAGKPPVILRAADGSVAGNFSSWTAPAFDGDLRFELSGYPYAGPLVLRALRDDSGAMTWSDAGDGHLSSAPIVVDGKVAIGSSTGGVFLYDEETGQQIWHGDAGAPITVPDEHNAWMLTGMAAADGMLFVPASTRLVAFRSAAFPLSATGTTFTSRQQSMFDGTVATFSDGDPLALASDYAATIDWGDGSPPSSGAITSTGRGTFAVDGSHAYQDLGAFNVSVTIEDGTGRHAAAVSNAVVYAVPASGGFVISDLAASSDGGGAVTFWGGQWPGANSMRGSLSGFAGFATDVTSWSCGASWLATPGASGTPPQDVPAYMAVLVTTSMSRTRNRITGDVAALVIVRTDPGFAPNPGHAGTGTIVARIC